MSEQATSTIEIARALAKDIASRTADADRLGKLPDEDIQALHESGYLMLSVPVEYGGQGLSLRECVAAQLELARGSASTALVAAMQLQVFGYARETRLWPEPIFAKFCRSAVQEGSLFNFLASEPVLGSPSRGGRYQTYAQPTPRGDGWSVNGHKNWATGGKHLTHLLVKLMIGDEPGVMYVPATLRGIDWSDTWTNVLSLRASESNDVRFKKVIVPSENLIERGVAKEPPNAWFTALVAATYLGTGLAARHHVIRYALDRVPTALGKPIATLPKIQRQIGEIDLALQAAQLLLMDAAGAWVGDGQNSDQQWVRIAAAKTLATETAIKVTATALQVAGGAGITGELPLERYFRDAQAGTTHPPSGDTAYEIIGQSAILREQNS